MAGVLQGVIDAVTHLDQIVGWIFDPGHPLAEVPLLVRYDGEDVLADVRRRTRGDLKFLSEAPIGFRIHLRKPVPARDWLGDRVKVVARGEDGGEQVLAFSRLGQQSLLTLALVESFKAHGDGAVDQFLSQVSGSGSLSADLRRPFHLVAAVRSRGAASPAEVATQMTVSVGSASVDGEAEIGHDGHIFLVGGSPSAPAPHETTRGRRRSNPARPATSRWWSRKNNPCSRTSSRSGSRPPRPC